MQIIDESDITSNALVTMPKRGYVGVGEVVEAVQPASTFTVDTEAGV